MKSRKELVALSQVVRGLNEGGMKSALARGLPYYGSLPSSYPRHFSAFSGMHSRAARLGLECDFVRDTEGFISFLGYIGDVPKGMFAPTVGREDHDVGYVKGNFAWQEKEENTSESATRNYAEKNRRMVGVCAKNERTEKSLLIAKKLKERGSLSDTVVMKITGNLNVQSYNCVSRLIRNGKIEAKIVGTRANGWILKIL